MYSDVFIELNSIKFCLLLLLRFVITDSLIRIQCLFADLYEITTHVLLPNKQRMCIRYLVSQNCLRSQIVVLYRATRAER